MPVRKLIVKAFVREVILDNDSVTITHNFNISTKNLKWHLGVCLSLNKSARYARRDKHTPCIKTNRLKRQNRSRAERAVRAKPLGESGPFFSHIGNAIFCPLFHRRIFSFFYIKLRNLLLSFRRRNCRSSLP